MPGIDESIALFIADADLAHQIVHGDANTTVTTEGGPVDSLARAVARISLTGTSTSSLTIGTGEKVFATQANKGWVLGQRLRAASDDGTKIMEGEVTAYSGTSLTLAVDHVEGAGTHADWNIGLAGAPGIDGTDGEDGTDGSDGATLFNGASDPAGGLGLDGDYYLQTAVGDTGGIGDIWLKVAGSWGIVGNFRGAAGLNGTNGATWSVGATDPSGGENGDLYLQLGTGDTGIVGDVWRKVAGTWGVIANIRGPAGNTWHQGSADPAGGTGNDGDLFIQFVAGSVGAVGDVWYKAGGSWSVVGNLRGPAGSGTGDVVGPAGATDGRVALFDGNTGKLIKDGGVLLSAIALLASPAFTGTPTAPTAAPGTNTTQIATTAFVKAAVDALVAAAPGVLDTLDELAAALGDDANFAATMTTALAGKAPLASPALTGNPTAPTQSTGDNSTKLATTAFVQSVSPVGLHTVSVPAGAMTSRLTAGASIGAAESSTNKVVTITLDFDPATTEYAQFQIPMPKSWNESTIAAQFIWTATNTGNVVWGIQGLAHSDDDALDAAFGSAQTVTDGVTAAGDLMISAATAAVSIGGTPAEGDLVTIQVYRDAASGSDTCTVDARLLAVRLTYTTNAPTDA